VEDDGQYSGLICYFERTHCSMHRRQKLPSGNHLAGNEDLRLVSRYARWHGAS
jgi:hypothetical protein